MSGTEGDNPQSQMPATAKQGVLHPVEVSPLSDPDNIPATLSNAFDIVLAAMRGPSTSTFSKEELSRLANAGFLLGVMAQWAKDVTA